MGMRGVGKSTLGRAVSQMLSWPFIDTDLEITKLYEKKTGFKKTAREIFQEGEGEFRLLEEEVVASLVNLDRHVIALGGGSTLSEKNYRPLTSLGLLLCLFLDKKNLEERHKKMAFILEGISFDSWYEKRLQSYQNYSCVWLRADRSNLEGVVRIIAGKFYGKG
ncbi:MAG: hypothetical protein JSR76_01275 [Verrucomicrobia bacterium]|nr:hypothetical protein [Verrucomicrobiota bacterium]